MGEIRLEVVGGRLCFSGSWWSLELYVRGWRPELVRLFRATSVEGLTGEETRIRLEGIRPLVTAQVLAKTTGEPE